MKFILAVSVICHAILPTAVNGFVPASPFLQRNNPQSQVTFSYDDDDNNNNKPNRHSYSTSSRLFMAKLWDRMEIEEDEEPMWYLLNCVAGLEIDLLRQCRQRCGDMEDAKKFVVPTITSTRSHGANRMVQDTKIKYQGYVFAKLRLCSETYEAIQGECIIIAIMIMLGTLFVVWTRCVYEYSVQRGKGLTTLLFFRIGSLSFMDGNR
jgi:hypothetical protein